ncbi:hypothetical protein L1987_44619 [Smallanthus sonchifolius]|uniref:Uncharacterized protein n=1 Tax=Smallanthus sonchifolius TaxID=185202 RepID=A0ACB9GQZ5_9ASTR|nr:hypothetical protein L1987_44619 [Smallanthus sonchifolius]
MGGESYNWSAHDPDVKQSQEEKKYENEYESVECISEDESEFVLSEYDEPCLEDFDSFDENGDEAFEYKLDKSNVVESKKISANDKVSISLCKRSNDKSSMSNKNTYVKFVSTSQSKWISKGSSKENDKPKVSNNNHLQKKTILKDFIKRTSQGSIPKIRSKHVVSKPKKGSEANFDDTIHDNVKDLVYQEVKYIDSNQKGKTTMT